MAASAKLAELYLEISTKGDYAAALNSIKDKMAAVNQQADNLQKMMANPAVIGNLARIAKVQNDIGIAVQKALNPSKEFQESIKGWSSAINAGAMALGGLSAAATGAAAAASPMVWETFTGSVRLVTASIGSAFIPALIEVSAWLQKTARWIQSLDQDQLKSIGRWIIWGGAIALAIPILVTIGKLVAAFIIGLNAATLSTGIQTLANYGLTGSFTTLSTAIGVTISRLLTLRGLLGLGLLSAVTLGVYAVGQAHEANRGATLQESAAQIGPNAQLSVNERRAQIARQLSDVEGFNLFRLGQYGRMRGGILRSFGATPEQMDEVHRILNASGSGITNQSIGQANIQRLAALIAQSGGNATSSQAYALMSEQERAQAALTGGGRPSLLSGRSSMAGRPGTVMLQGGQQIQQNQNQGLLAGYSFQSQIISLEQQWARLQTMGASISPLEQANLDIQRANNNYLMQIAQNTTPAGQPVGGVAGAAHPPAAVLGP